MMGRRQSWLGMVLLTGLFAVLGGCGIDMANEGQLAGQECFVDQDCVEGTRCIERRCRPLLGSGEATGEEEENSREDEDEEIFVEPDGECESGQRGCHQGAPWVCREGGWEENGPVCEEGSQCVGGACVEQEDEEEEDRRCDAGRTRCGGGNVVEICSGDGWETVGACEPDEVCRDAACVPADSDDPDDDSGSCCEGGCGTDQVCTDCVCQDYDVSVCEYQDQPCANEGQVANGFVCSAFGRTSQLRCYGICNALAADPDASCPGDGPSVCLVEEESPNGLCVSACEAGDPCGDSRQRCILHGQSPLDGLCFPATGQGDAGESCNGEDAFSCSDANLCLEGRCEETCRPFRQGDSDCEFGESCLPFDEHLGVCRPDTQDASGMNCQEEMTTCGRDATGCFPTLGTGGLSCYEFCRLGSNQDCSDSGSICLPHDPDNQAIGVCF